MAVVSITFHPCSSGSQAAPSAELDCATSNTFCQNPFIFWCVLSSLGRESPDPLPVAACPRGRMGQCSDPSWAALLAAVMCGTVGAPVPWKCQSWLRVTQQYLLWERGCFTGCIWYFCTSLGVGLDTMENSSIRHSLNWGKEKQSPAHGDP